MSADYGTEHYKGYRHRRDGHPDWIHVAYRGSAERFGDFNLADIGELVKLAGQAWPAAAGVEVRYVIEMRRRDGERRPWTLVWSALADEGQDIGVSEDYAQKTLEGFTDSRREWRLSRRTVVSADEPLGPGGPG